MTPPEECHRYREQIGAFLLGKLDGGELEAMQTHLNNCPVCRAEVREFEPVVAALADADPDRIDEDAWPPGDLEETTLAPILEEIHRARGRGRRLRWSPLAAAAICVVAMGLAGFIWFLEPAAALVEPLKFSVAPDIKVDGNLIAHAWGTEIGLIASGLRDGQTYEVTLVSGEGKRVDSGTFIGTGGKPVRSTFTAALPRKDAARLEVRTSEGEPAFFAKLPEEPRERVRDWPLFGILPWAGPNPHNVTMGPSAEDPPKAAGSGGGEPTEGSPPKDDVNVSSPGGGKPDAAPTEGSQPGGGLHGPPASTPPASTPPASTPPASTPPASTPPASTPPAPGPPPVHDQY
jgi:hypothetical protein